MKKRNEWPILFLSFVFLLISCGDDMDDLPGKEYRVATPLTADLVQFKEEALEITEPIPITQSGKIYAYKNYIFINDVNQGFHVIDNSDPNAPKNLKFIRLEGNYDISIKDDRLYADSYGDLVVLDISNIDDIKTIARMENAIYQQYWCTVGWDVAWPEADIFDYGSFDATKEAIVGWEVKTQRLSDAEVQQKFGGWQGQADVSFVNSSSNEAFTPSAPSSNTGQGGSLARFKIVGDYLYAVEWASISVFDISDLEKPKVLEDVYTNGTVETIFNQGNILFIGGTQGMYIYDISSPDKPEFVSEFVHGTACDPVVVDGDYAYITLRAGNTCGNTESGLYIVNVSNLKKPELEVIYPMDEPYGLGIQGHKLFVCDGNSGLKVYDKSDAPNITSLSIFPEIFAYDVIPLNNSLLMIGDKVLYQYEYIDNNIRLLSTLQLD
ncbi:MAG: hypothetical protein WBM83_15290 [Flavobacteriaceae bacterium]